MEDILIGKLGVSYVKQTGRTCGGCINKGQVYETDTGPIFVKDNFKPGANVMFTGEFEGLEALRNTGCVRVPKPIKVIELPKNGFALVMEYIDMKHLRSCAADLGRRLARLHLHNIDLQKEETSRYISQYGFHSTTCCGFLPQDNTWTDDWPTFFANYRLQPQIDRLVEEKHDRELLTRWSSLSGKVPRFFRGLEMFPSLLHGDLWSGNAAQTKDPAEPVVFDPAVVYGHHEFDLSIARMFGGFGKDFYEAYHTVIPQSFGFSTREELYQLYHYLNHYNHFGSGYRQSCLDIMDRLNKLGI